MQKMFKSIDLNDDGIVTLEEFLHALEGAGVAVGHEIDRARAQVSEEEAARMLAYFDRSSTGYLLYKYVSRLLVLFQKHVTLWCAFDLFVWAI